MAEEGFAWMYLVFFLVIPLSRIIPRIIKKYKDKNHKTPEQFTQAAYQPAGESIADQQAGESIADQPRKTFQAEIPKEMSPQTLDMLVLGELNRGTNNFNSIQSNLGIDNSTLEKILQSLEDKGLMTVQNKQGLLGPKVELILTEKGLKKFFS